MTVVFETIDGWNPASVSVGSILQIIFFVMPPYCPNHKGHKQYLFKNPECCPKTSLGFHYFGKLPKRHPAPKQRRRQSSEFHLKL